MKKEFRKVLSTCLAAVMLLSTAVVAPVTVTAAQTLAVSTGETSGDFEYAILDDGTAEITKYTGSATKLAIPSELDGKKVTSIGQNSFEYCTSLTSIVIPDSVTKIDYDAFSGCTSLASIIIPDSVTSIGINAFYFCTSLTSITIPDSVTEIDSGVFCDCTSLTNIFVGSKNASYTSIDGVLFDKQAMTIICYPAGKKSSSYSIPDSVTSIGWFAFSGCENLTSVTIPNSVTSINGNAFSGCTSLTDVTIPNSVTSIDFYVFDNCTSLTSVTIPDSVTSIGMNAFSGCASLASIIIPNSVTEIEFGAFEHCISLTSITIPNRVTSIGDSVFYGCASLKDVTIPDSITSIGERAFSGCTSLTDITIPNRVTNILYEAFNNCTSLTNVTIPDSVKSIDSYAFFLCKSLTSIAIPNSVTSIGEDAFKNCTSLTSVTIPDSVTSIGDDAFGYYYDNDYNEVKIDGFTIKGYKGSAAETYANDNGFEFISLGDVPTEVPTTEPTTEPTTVEPTTEPTEPATVITDKDTNVSVEGDIPEGVELNVESAEAVVENAVAAYNITLEKDGKAVQPDGKVTVKMPVPEGVDGSQCKVYYIDGDSKTDMNAVFVDGYLVFETDHFSVYAVVKTEKTSVLLGDVNADGKVNIKDATTIQKSAASLVTLTDEQSKAADVNADGKVNVNDATVIQKYTAGIDTGFKIGE